MAFPTDCTTTHIFLKKKNSIFDCISSTTTNTTSKLIQVSVNLVRDSPNCFYIVEYITIFMCVCGDILIFDYLSLLFIVDKSTVFFLNTFFVVKLKASSVLPYYTFPTTVLSPISLSLSSEEYTTKYLFLKYLYFFF